MGDRNGPEHAAQMRYVFDNGIFVELRHGKGFSKSESRVTPEVEKL
jgi:hypothetical protein